MTLYRAPVMVIWPRSPGFIVSPRLRPLLLACIPLLAVVIHSAEGGPAPQFKRMLKMMDGMNQAVRENRVVASRVVSLRSGGFMSQTV